MKARKGSGLAFDEHLSLFDFRNGGAISGRRGSAIIERSGAVRRDRIRREHRSDHEGKSTNER